VSLKNAISVAPRFTRSIQLERDFANPNSIDGYVLTSAAASLLTRIASSISRPEANRAWSISGAYGSGKSAFALYLAAALSPSQSQASILARNLLKAQKPDTFEELFDKRRRSRIPATGYCPVLVSGVAEPLAPSILTGVSRQLRQFLGGKTKVAPQVVKLLHQMAASSRSVKTSRLVDAVVEASVYLQRSGKAAGILLVVDELGKFLEYGARRPEQGDIFVLQQLAEAAADPRNGIILVTVLHQAFEAYASGLRPTVRAEWSKIQGRFEDVAFQDSAEELVKLISHAITHNDSRAIPNLNRAALQNAETAADLQLMPPGMSRREFVALMRNCSPLHPVTVLTLARLCRKFGQNQRSLFSFLTSREPHGFTTFLEAEGGRRSSPLFLLSDLYDYMADALGNGLAAGEGGTRWAEIQNALDKTMHATPEQIRLIKTIGLLAVVGVYGELRSSPNVLALALNESKSSTVRTCDALVRASTIVYRKHSQSFALWQGSDIDVDERLHEASLRVSPDANTILARLAAVWAPRPLVAKKHFLKTGTLRYFKPRLVDATSFARNIEPDPEADGLLLYAVPADKADREEIIRQATSALVRTRRDVLIAVPEETELLRASFRQLELLKWVQTNTPELHGDGVARREIQARARILEENLESDVHRLFAFRPDQRTLWYHCGLAKSLNSQKALARILSDICDDVFPSTPFVKNELVNRRYLSSAAAAARRNLIERMISASDQPDLGITGTPPEFSIYVSMLLSTGLHQQDETGWCFNRPQKAHILPAWDHIEQFFADSELKRRPVSELFGSLQRPPYGLKLGLLPVLFCAAVLAHDTEIALYENSAFVPEVTIELFERLLRSAERFEVRSFRVEGVRKQVFSRFAALLPGPDLPLREERLVSVIRPLYRFFNRLPDYAKKATSLSAQTLKVRSALFASKDPDILLFEELPNACSVPPFTSNSKDLQAIPLFFKRLKNALAELQRCYDDLLSKLQQQLFGTLAIDGPNGREILRFRAQVVLDYAVDSKLKAFILHLSNDDLSDVLWIEAIGTLLAGKPPRTWTEGDIAKFDVALTEVSRNFCHREAIAFEVSRGQMAQSPGEVFRIGITDLHSKEVEAVVSVAPGDSPKLAQVVLEIESRLEELGLSNNPKLSIAALAMVSKGLLSELQEDKVTKLALAR